MATRYDSIGTLKKPVRSDEGFLTLHGYLTRSGVFKYRNADGTVRREYRPEEEVSRADSIDTLRNKPVTLRHPRNGDGEVIKITPANIQAYGIGSVGHDVSYDKSSKHVPGSVHVTRGDGIEAVEQNKLRDLSCVYDCDLVHEPGISPDGDPYDIKQTNIRYNSVAITERGRGGSTRLRADEAELVVEDDGTEEPEQKKGKVMAKFTLNGVEYEVEDNGLARDVADLKTLAETAKSEASDAQKSIQTLEGERDALKEKLEEVSRADEFDVEAYKERRRLEEFAERAGVEVDTQSNAALKREIVNSQLNSTRADADDAYFDAAFDVLASGKLAKERRKSAASSAMSGAGETSKRADEAESLTVAQQEQNFISGLRKEQ